MHVHGMESKDPRGLSEVGRRLRYARIASGYPVQAAWCRVTGITAPAWNNYEAGFRRINVDDAWKVTQVTGVSLDWIYGGLKRGISPDLLERIARLEAEDRRMPEADGGARRNRKPNNNG
jgi:transcriptional regulator with XRE-family HTH domain